MKNRTELEQEFQNVIKELDKHQGQLAGLNDIYNKTYHTAKLKVIRIKTKYLRQKMNILGNQYDRCINRLAII